MRKIGIVGLLICMLVIPSFLASAEHTDTIKAIITLDDDVPVWNKEDSWTYIISDFWVDYSDEGIGISMNGIIDDFKWTVSDTSGTNYKVDVTGKISASYEASIPFVGRILNVSGTINPPLNRLTGTIIFNKSNLEIEDFTAVIKGITTLMIHSISIKFPIPIRITADADLSTPLPLFDFPLHILKFWAMPEMDITTYVNFGGIFGLFKIPIKIFTHYDWIPGAFSCLNKENITVKAGTYDAWKIQSLLGGFFEYYYAPIVGNLVKMDVNMPRGGIQGELKETNYE